MLPAGIYVLTRIGANEGANASGDLDVLSDITIEGAGAATTVIDGNGTDRVLNLHNGSSLAIPGVTIANGDPGNGWGFGGGIQSIGAELEVLDSVIRDNLGYGGGIYAASSVVNIENTTITNNSGEGGSGLRQDRGTVNIINTTISGNAMTREGSGSFGGAAILYQSTSGAGTLNIDHSTITDNTSASVGGGISISLLGGSVTVNLKNSIVANNTAVLVGPDCNGTIESAGFNIPGTTPTAPSTTPPATRWAPVGAPSTHYSALWPTMAAQP